MAIGLKGMFARGIGITGAAEGGLFMRGFLNPGGVITQFFNMAFMRRRRRM